LNTRKIKKKNQLNQKISVNYIGDGRYIGIKKAERIAEYVINRYWKHKRKLSGRSKLDINVVSRYIIKKVNREYLNKNRPTDVIAFAFAETDAVPGEKYPILGQVIISIDAAKKQAVDYGHSVRDEMKLLLVHGLLHVAGWPEGEKIRKCQKEILKNIQIRIL
jgi:probable rRNA maturation factor